MPKLIQNLFIEHYLKIKYFVQIFCLVLRVFFIIIKENFHDFSEENVH